MKTVPDLERAVRMAYRVLVDRQVASLPVDPLELLRACRDTRVLTTAEAAEAMHLPLTQVECLFAPGVEAITLQMTDHGRTAYAVVYQAGGNPARLRFTLAHELGHRVLQHCDTHAVLEREADCFASHLLCPTPVLQRLLMRFGGRIAPEQIAAACYVSYSCALTILRRENIVTDSALTAEVDGLLTAAVDSFKPIQESGRLKYRMIGSGSTGNVP